MFKCFRVARITNTVLVAGYSTIMAIAVQHAAFAQEAEPKAPYTQESISSANDENGVEVLTRGPLHEAFAEPHRPNPEPSAIVKENPPAALEEVPAEYRPDGKQVEWIPGYWAWEAADSRFVWVSGLWRDIPPGMRWIPGYWEKADDGHRWVTGFWADQQTEEVAYLPPPPSSVENGPSSPAPGLDHFYVPGNWVYHGEQYNWRPGYWAPIHEHWVWIPATYIWTPRGCIFRPGYWDLEVVHRGLVFAPVYFSEPIYHRPNYYYSPRVVFDLDFNLLVHLFLGPDRSHYYYGDYYGQPRGGLPYYAWADLHTRHSWYDPLYAYYDSLPRQNSVNVIDWVDRQHRYFEQNANFRPRSTLRAQTEFVNEMRNSNALDPNIGRLVTIGRDVQELARESASDKPLRRLAEDEQRVWRERVKPYHQMAENRVRAEVQVKTRAGTEAKSATRLPLPRLEQLPSRQVDLDRSNQPAEKQERNRALEQADRRTADPKNRDPKNNDRPRTATNSRPEGWPPGRERSDVPRERPTTEPGGADKADRRATDRPTPAADPRTTPQGNRRDVPKDQRNDQPKSDVPNQPTTPPAVNQPRRQDQATPKPKGVQRSYRPADNQRGSPSKDSDDKGAQPTKQRPPTEKPQGDEQRGRDKEKDKDKDGSQ